MGYSFSTRNVLIRSRALSCHQRGLSTKQYNFCNYEQIDENKLTNKQINARVVLASFGSVPRGLIHGFVGTCRPRIKRL